MGNIALSIEGLSVGYDGRTIFKDLSFELQRGHLLAVMGGSGSGKSTLLRAISGFLKPLSGRIEINGVLVTDNGAVHVPASERGVGLVFQNYALFPHMSVADNVAFGIRHEKDKGSRVRELLALVELSGFEHRSIDTLSGGQKQRVALVRALAPKPDLILLDEPFANLDVEIRRPIANMLKRVIEREDTAAVLVTHDGREALSLAHSLAILESDGDSPAKLSQVAKAAEVYWQPATQTVARLTGDVMITTGVRQGAYADTALGRIEVDQAGEGEVKLAIRPASVQWSPDEQGAARVDDVYFCGPGYTFKLRIGEEELELPNQPNTVFVGQRLSLTLSRPAVVLCG